jgi:DnaJ-class molecular chaperone
MNDYYKILGIDRSASADDIKKAYRKMAAKHHPDRGGSTEEFQKIEEAYRNLSDPELKSQHDNPNPFGGGGPGGFNGFPGGFSFSFGGGNPFDDIFAQFTRQRQQRVYTVSLWVTLEQVARGSEEPVQFNTEQGIKTFSIKIPKGVQDGQQVRYQNLMPDGDLQIEFRVHRHQVFERRNNDLYVTMEISVFDLILGTTIKVPTIHGDELEVTVPPRTKPGTTLRMSGRGLDTQFNKGDQFVLISATIPDTISDALLSLMEQERQPR